MSSIERLGQYNDGKDFLPRLRPEASCSAAYKYEMSCSNLQNVVRTDPATRAHSDSHCIQAETSVIHFISFPILVKD